MKRNIIISVFISLAIGVAVGVYDVFNPIILDECGDWAHLPLRYALKTNALRASTRYDTIKKQTDNQMIISLFLCPRKDSNLHASRHTHLKRARLPIPPLGH